MKRFFKGFMSLVLVASSISGYALGIDGNTSFAQEKVVVSDGENTYLSGQLIVSIEQNSLPPTRGGDEMSEQISVMEDSGIEVIDSLLDTQDDVRSLDTDSIGPINEELKEEAVENMGYVYLVGYQEDEYKNLEEAEKGIEEKLEEKGLKVRYVEPNYEVKALEDIDSAQELNPSQAWHYNMIKAPEAWKINEGSSNVKIAILDTGIDNNHPNLKNFVDMSLAKSFAGGTSMDKHGHGTHVAGTIASYGQVSGVMRNASLVPVKVLGDNGTGSNYGIQQAILYAANINADVVNMSLGGGGYARGMDEACKTATNRGVAIIAATGNDGTAKINYPAAYDSVLSVGAVDSNRTRTYFSQYGQGLDVMAPGHQIYSTVPNASFGYKSGTSMATPHVAGVAGLIRSTNKNLTAEQVKDILKSTAVPAGSTYEYGNGIVNAEAAVIAAGGQKIEKQEEVKEVVNK